VIVGRNIGSYFHDIYTFTKLFYTISVYLHQESIGTDGPHKDGSGGDHMRIAVEGTT
jgi:hypothetical protein